MTKLESSEILVVPHILLSSLMLAAFSLGRKVKRFGLGKCGIGLILCVGAQITLGIGSRVVKSEWPSILSDQQSALSFVAIASLMLGLLTFVLCWAIRVTDFEAEPVGTRHTKMEVAS